MVKERATFEDRIITDPEILVGKPVVRGTRIPVELVLEHLAENPDLEDLFSAFPRLTSEAPPQTAQRSVRRAAELRYRAAATRPPLRQLLRPDR